MKTAYSKTKKLQNKDQINLNALFENFSSKSPDAIYIAAAGPDYGLALCYELEDHRLIAQVNTANHLNYKIINQNDAPSSCFDIENLSQEDALIHFANIHGIEALPAAKSGDSGPLLIVFQAENSSADIVREYNGIKIFHTFEDAVMYLAISLPDNKSIAATIVSMRETKKLSIKNKVLF